MAQHQLQIFADNFIICKRWADQVERNMLLGKKKHTAGDTGKSLF